MRLHEAKIRAVAASIGVPPAITEAAFVRPDPMPWLGDEPTEAELAEHMRKVCSRAGVALQPAVEHVNHKSEITSGAALAREVTGAPEPAAVEEFIGEVTGVPTAAQIRDFTTQIMENHA